MSKLVPLLMAATGLNRSDLSSIITNAPSRYKTYRINKRRGGERIISQPAVEVKALQRVLVEEVLSKLPIHEAATAYRQNLSIRNNADAHAKNRGPILKFDFADFFPSILARDWYSYCSQSPVFEDPEDVQISTKILFHRPQGSSILQLAIGAPSSPRLSNILMYKFDSQIAEMVAKDSVTYTRYADDLTFSARRTGFLLHVESMLRRVVKELKSPALTINEDKTVLATPKYRRVVTGLVLANDGQVSLGRDRKRKIRASIHHYLLHKLSAAEQVHLAGTLAFVNAVEPDFLDRLAKKFGSDVIARIKSSRAHASTETPHFRG